MNKNRFLQVLRWELLLSKRQMATMALTFFGLVVIPQILTLVFKSSSSSAYTMGIISSVALSAYLLCSGALIFSSLRSRQQRINSFMLPASNKEKFIARYLVLVVAMPLAAIAGFLIGDLVQHLLTMIFGSNHALWAVSSAADSITHTSFSGNLMYVNGQDYTLNGVIGLLMALIVEHACFLFFGSIFHKHPLVMAILTWMGLGILLLCGATAGGYMLSELLGSGYTVTLYNYWWEALYYVFSIALTVFCYWFAYRRYARLQVINNQWINK